MCIFSKWKDVFGKPGEGVHKTRIFGFAAVDLVLTIILAIILAKIIKINIFCSIGTLMVLSILFHLLFGVNTELIKRLNLDCDTTE